ncbi:MAG: SufD family Fe-S cluster assembly protein, partial [Deltaproteobacteria bacterium]
DEYWRFTDPQAVTANVAEAAGFAAPHLTAETSAHVEIIPLSQALKSDQSWVTDVYGQIEATAHTPVRRPLAALVAAFATDGQAIRVTGDGGQLVIDHAARQTAALSHSVITVEAGASLTLIEIGAPPSGALTLIEADLADGASLHHIRLQDAAQTGVSHVFVRIGANATYQGFTLGAQGKALRNESVLTLAGAAGRAHIAAAWIGQGDAHHDDTVFITHAAPHCESRQVFRSVLGRGAVTAFQGKILVEQIAQKTDGYQLSQALLLDEDAQFLGKPELEIYADDVKCSHGSTTGSIDETSLYYLRSRGVPERQARHLLVLAFLNGTLDEVADPALRDMLETRISALSEAYLA